MKVIAFIDGASKGNPGPAGAGVFIIDAKDMRELRRLPIPLGVCTNNVAEYRALLAAIDEAIALGATEIEIRSDSKLLVEQMAGSFRIKNPELAKLATEALRKLARFRAYRLVFVRREENRISDQLASLAANASKLGAGGEDEGLHQRADEIP